MSDKEYKSIGLIIDKILKSYGVYNSINQEILKSNWVHIAGKTLSKQCQPIKVEKQILFLKVKNSIWMHELFLKKSDLISLIMSKFDKIQLKDIKFI